MTLPAPYYQDDLVTLYHGDSVELLPLLHDRSAGLILTDPPYFRVKGDWWDRQWDTADGFLAWVGGLADEWRRVLSSSGSLYCFASPKMGARVEVTLSERFEILNRVRWMKDAGWHNRAEKEALRSYLSPWEEVIFAEQFGQDTTAEGGYAAAESELRASVFEPVRLRLVAMLKDSGWTKSAIDDAMGFQMSGHYFGRSQWSLPTAEHYARMQEITGGFVEPYEDLRAEYEDLRRPFNVTAQHQYTDVWSFPTVANYPGKHPCEKPQAMLRHIIDVSHRPDLPPVLDCFAGTGSTLRAAKDLGRKAIGIEIDERYCELAANRLGQGVLSFDGV